MKTAILHYSAPPGIGGVEAVIEAHAREFVRAGFPVTVIAGTGDADAMPRGVDFVRVTEMASSHPEIEAATLELNAGRVPDNFDALTGRLAERLRPVVSGFDRFIIHNILTKHFNLSLTAALFHLMDEGLIKSALAWCHDLTWTSPHSRSQVHPGFPWELLKTPRKEVTYVAISEQRWREIIDLFGVRPEEVPVVPNGVDPAVLLGLSAEGEALADRLDLWRSGLILLMPVRVTQAKNIELGLRVTAALKERGLDPRLVVTGPPDPHDPDSMEYFKSLLSLRRELGVDKEVRFVFASGPEGRDAGYTIGQNVVAELYRAADALFMPSHREGFGMPVLEASLLGRPVITTPVPAVGDLELDRVLLIGDADEPGVLAARIAAWLEERPEHSLRVRMRREFTWKAIFERRILPLLGVPPEAEATGESVGQPLARRGS